jgi:hypothetical protein
VKKYIGLIIGLLPLIASAQVVITTGSYVVLNGGGASSPAILVLTSPATTAITNAANSWIVSENEYNKVQWPIGTSTGSYVVPFGYGNSEYLPVTCDITTAGTGSGTVSFSTYHGSSWDNALYEPSDVTNMTDYGVTDYSLNAADRFWIVDAEGYTTKPSPNLTFTYSQGTASDIALPNYIVEPALIAQRFNNSSDVWTDFYGTTGTNVISGSTGSITSGPVTAADFYRSWTLFNDSNLVTSVPQLVKKTTVITFPNPTNGLFTVSGVTAGQVIQLFDYLGQSLGTQIVGNTDAVNFDISDKANGLYIMRILNSNGSMVTQQKIVKAQ